MSSSEESQKDGKDKEESSLSGGWGGALNGFLVVSKVLDII